MKKLFVLLFACVISLNLMAQKSNFDYLVNKYGDSEELTTVKISPYVLKFAQWISEDEDLKAFHKAVKNFEGIRIAVWNAEDAQMSTTYEEDATRLYSDASYAELMTVEQAGEQVRFMIQEGTKEGWVNELVMLVKEKDSFVVMDLKGEIDIQALAELSEDVDIDGFEHLNKILDDDKR